MYAVPNYFAFDFQSNLCEIDHQLHLIIND